MTSPLRNQIVKEILISLVAITTYRLLLDISIPFINLDEFNVSSDSLYGFFIGDNFLDHFSIAALGIMPFVTAYMLVEICSLFIPFLKKHRRGDYSGRKVLKKYALIITLLVGVIQAAFVIHGLQGILSPLGNSILVFENNFQFIALVLTLVATVFVLLFITEIVTKYGGCNGISLLIFSGVCFSFMENISYFFNSTNEIPLNFFYEIIFSIVMFILLIIIPIFLVKNSSVVPTIHDSDTSVSKHFKLTSCLSGTVALGYTTSIIMLPVTLMSFMGGFESLANSLSPGTFWYYFFSCIIVFLLSYLFGWLFLHPKKRLETLKSWGWNTTDPEQYSIDLIKRKFFLMHFPWAIVLCGMIIFPSISIKYLNIPVYLGGSACLIIAFISLDFISRFNLWNANVHEKTFKIAEFQDVHYATMIKSHLHNEGIKFYLQGYYHRHLLYFFGPYIPINLMIPIVEKERVEEIITQYYGKLGLLDNN